MCCVWQVDVFSPYSDLAFLPILLETVVLVVSGGSPQVSPYLRHSLISSCAGVAYEIRNNHQGVSKQPYSPTTL